MASKQVWGVISSDGNYKNSQGIKDVDRQSKGTYLITFQQSFLDRPAAFAQRVIAQSVGDDTRRNCLLQNLTPDTVIVLTGTSSGDLADSDFSFLAYGLV